MSDVESSKGSEPATLLKHRIYELLDGIAEKISLSFALYESSGDWASLYHDAEADSLCGFARRANPTSGRCRDEELQMARAALETAEIQRGACWQGNMRWVIPVIVDGRAVLAVSLCGFGLDRVAQANDYLPAEIARALGLDGNTPRRQAFPGDSALRQGAAEVIAELLVKAIEALARDLES